MGGCQTDKERAYVALSRAREQTQIYVSREDLGEAGMDPGAIERLADRMRRSGAQEASVSREVADERQSVRLKSSARSNRTTTSTRGSESSSRPGGLPGWTFDIPASSSDRLSWRSGQKETQPPQGLGE